MTTNVSIITYFRQKWQPLVLAFAFVWLYFANITPGSYLIGWDNLQTELYPWIGVKRAFFSVWQEYQSFGLLAGMAHASDLPRAVIVYLMSFVLPNWMIRYTIHMMLLFIGSVGAYMLLLHVFSRFKSFQKNAALIGALGYLLHFATIQLFSLPFESFSYFYANLPWSIWIWLRLATHKTITPRHLLGFITVFFMSSPAYYVQTFFIVHTGVLGLLSLVILWGAKSRWQMLKRLVLLGVLFLTVNLYWILPQVYFVAQNGAEVVKNSKINALSTEDVVYQNREYGTLGHVLRSESYYLTFSDGENGMSFLPWLRYRENPFIQIITVVMILLMIIGLWGKQKIHVFFLGLLGISLTALASDSLLFSLPHNLARHIDIVNQIFRSPFTKFGFVYALAGSYFIARGAVNIYELSKNNLKVGKSIITLGAVSIIFISSVPAFTGNIFSRSMKVVIPDEYFQTFEYFKSIDADNRIALLPDYTFWGWFDHTWGYYGSGFLWYGIEQPIVSRTFDTWSHTSEGYYWELKEATDADDAEHFQEVLEKYDINYLILDSSLKPVTPTSELIMYDRLLTLIGESPSIEKKEVFGSISIYSVKQTQNTDSFVSLTSQLPSIISAVTYTTYDHAYESMGEYITSTTDYDRYYPFRDLQSYSKDQEKQWSVEIQESNIVFKTTIPEVVIKSSPVLEVPTVDERTSIYANEEFQIFSNHYSVSNEGSVLIVKLPKQEIQAFDMSTVQKNICDNQQGESVIKNYSGIITISSSGGATGCLGFETYQDLPHTNSYLLSIESENISGRTLLMYMVDDTRKAAFIEDRIENGSQSYIIPSRSNWGLGYSINFHNNSYERDTSENAISSLKLYYIPLEFLRTIYIRPENAIIPTQSSNQTTTFDVTNINYALYHMEYSQTTDQDTLILSQAYHPGWKAYEMSCDGNRVSCNVQKALPFLFGKELTDHVLVNNWANGFLLETGSTPEASNLPTFQPSNPGTYIILFWPQYLQFAGFGILGMTIFGLILNLVWNRKKKDSRV